MEKLIKIQAILNQIEEMSFEPKFRSQFNYKGSQTLEIETYCKAWAIAIVQIVDNIEDTATYIVANTKIRIIEFKN